MTYRARESKARLSPQLVFHPCQRECVGQSKMALHAAFEAFYVPKSMSMMYLARSPKVNASKTTSVIHEHGKVSFLFTYSEANWSRVQNWDIWSIYPITVVQEAHSIESVLFPDIAQSHSPVQQGMLNCLAHLDDNSPYRRLVNTKLFTNE